MVTREAGWHTFLRSRLLLYLLDEEVKHLRLDKLLDKVASVLGFQFFVELPCLEDPGLTSLAQNVRREMADRLDEEV